jgi:hypothetical protein
LPNGVYDSNTTDRGNPHALVAIADELGIKGTPSSNAYEVTYIIYDGVGASGMLHAALLNKRFLIDPAYADIRESLVAHEFYHTLGIPDGYDQATGTSTTADLMGLGRLARPLPDNFLEHDTLAHLGL